MGKRSGKYFRKASEKVEALHPAWCRQKEYMSENSYNFYLRAETSTKEFQRDDCVNRVPDIRKLKV
jgi:hypothetical protein